MALNISAVIIRLLVNKKAWFFLPRFFSISGLISLKIIMRVIRIILERGVCKKFLWLIFLRANRRICSFLAKFSKYLWLEMRTLRQKISCVAQLLGDTAKQRKFGHCWLLFNYIYWCYLWAKEMNCFSSLFVILYNFLLFWLQNRFSHMCNPSTCISAYITCSDVNSSVSSFLSILV